MIFNQNQMGRMIGQYMWATGASSTTPKVSVYDIETRAVGTYTVVNNLSTSTSVGIPTTGFPTTFRWNPNGTTLAVAYSASPYIWFFNKIGNGYTKLDNPSVIGNKAAQSCAWHPSGDFCVVGFESSSNNGQIMCYERSGNTFTNTGTFDTAITSTIAVYALAFNPQGDTLAVGMPAAPYLAAYKFDRTTKSFTKIVNPFDTTPTARVDSVSWNHDGSSLAVAWYASPRVYVYNRSGDSFTKIANPATIPTGNGTGVAWGGTNSEYLLVSHEVSPRLAVYYRTGDVLNKAANPALLPPNNCTGGDISADGNFIICSIYLNPVSMYRRDTATTNTWINIGQGTGTPSYARHPHIYPANNGQ